MSIERRKKRAAQSHTQVFADVLAGFYEFLGKKPQPTTEEVRAEFIRRDQRWKQYCAKKQLTSAYNMFKAEVAALWKRNTKEVQDTTDM